MFSLLMGGSAHSEKGKVSIRQPVLTVDTEDGSKMVVETNKGLRLDPVTL